ncbi:cysteinyl-tRNA synthetase [Luteibacter sp. 621]|jgi:cysteinyl-tRNA synthetase|uniref:hypothetical protein n=1 Tax=Luteibacter sp. 621 TaxID=3373916 RepID=UPI003D210F4F
MKSKPKANRKSWVGHACRGMFAMSLTAGAGLYAIPTHAQWIVTDPTIISNDLEEFVKDAARWTETASHYASQVQFWENNLIKLKSLQYELLRTQQQFQEVDDNFGVEERCPGAALISGDITTTMTSAMSQLTGDIKAQQNAVCVLTQRTRNQRYNNTVKYLQQMTTQTGTLEQLTAVRLAVVGDSPGKLQGLQDDTARFGVNVAQARDSWKTTDEQLGAQIDALNEKQTTLAKQALDGKPTVLGTVVNAAILEAALKVGN